MSGRSAVKVISVIILAGIFLTPVKKAGAGYVLPYPSQMPGSKLYTVMQVIDRFQGFISWGNITSFKYHLSLSDKYLVEAKTLFEYNQYLLGSRSLDASDRQAELLLPLLQKAKTEKKDVSVLSQTLKAAMEKHVEVLTRLSQTNPEQYLWQDEKQPAVLLHLKVQADRSIRLRRQIAVIAGEL